MASHSIRHAGRYASGGLEWHTHEFTHVHVGGNRDAGQHDHIFVTDPDHGDQLRAVLRAAATSQPVTAEVAAAAQLLELVAD